jgi:DNA-binding beta-propeller fold protein YncE
MTTRRGLLAAGGAAVLGGCTARVRPAAAPVAVPDALLVDTTRGLALVHGARCDVLGTAVATADARTVYATAPVSGGGTRLTTIRTATRSVSASVRLDGAWVPRVASVDGGMVALMPPVTAGKAARARTRILVADRDGPRYRLDLAGNVEPDAFGHPNGALFVLDWLPPAAPDRYRVRAVDLNSGVPGPLLTRNKTLVPAGAEEEMRGQARQAVFAPDLSTLYTLYTNQPDHQHTRDLVAGRRGAEVPAFVHTLSLKVGWAYCVDLPHPFGHAAAAAHTVAITPDGRTLLVADFGSGKLAVVDTENLVVRQVVSLPMVSGGAWSVVAPDGGRLYLGVGSRVYPVDLGALTVAASWDLAGAVRGLAASPDGSRLLIGYSGAVGWVDAASGRQLGRLPVAGLTQLRTAI